MEAEMELSGKKVLKRSPTSAGCSQTDNPALTILHFNDVYEVEARTEEPVGGAARFATALKEYNYLNPLIIFSGDCFNPSLLSTVTKGKHMVSILNAIGVQYAVLGNHEFDFGVDQLEEHMQQTRFPWFLSNVYDKFTSQSLGHGVVNRVIEWNDMKIGLMGLVEEDWLDTLATVEKLNLNYVDYVVVANQLSEKMRAEGAELIIAMTHMRWSHDMRLARNSPVDLILGGHDHDYGIKNINGSLIIKSGSDFRNLSKIDIIRSSDGTFEYTTQKIDILKHLEEDSSVKAIIEEFTLGLQDLLQEVLCRTEVALDGRFATVRKSESNLGNLITNAMLEATRADVALLNSGTLRSDCLHPAGDFTMRDLLLILPFVDLVLVVKVTGQRLLEALENGVSNYPSLDGRFPQVAGIEFGFDPDARTGQRVIADSVKIQGQHLEKNKVYMVAIKEYLTKGKDGYWMFQDCPWMFDTESAQLLSTIVINHFESVKVIQGLKKCKSGHWMNLVKVSQSPSLTVFENQEEGRAEISPVPGVEGRIYLVTQE
ncbi:trifunctional nucleotide phosphoesterase protein YfkN-like [Latimeria chalumnae]|uniref:Ecto-5'-nucleotidase n=1 Tax=Latimeria chalumnae TaxID=7897 RepID=H3A661_LATCH|nr:PREDICTED: trifunctional nucleotide phosphoesterase protein YfkN-like [Latimeria chalumnae]|eukprot:XP_014352103.1 PREDICTED: trifunctional nucleotide phosphoesterase protein YfkN-like [Latimeria chalumnae]